MDSKRKLQSSNAMMGNRVEFRQLVRPSAQKPRGPISREFALNVFASGGLYIMLRP
jgi:hypothetical protein